MVFNQEDIKHIAGLARIKLDPEEEIKYGSQLGSVLDYINQLQAVNTKKIEPTAQVSGLADVWRTDGIKDWPRDEVAAALSQGELEAGQVKVKKVL